MQIQRFEFNLFGENTYVIYDAESLEAAVIDPGMSDAQEVNKLSGYIKEHSLKLKYILLTHAHIDHTFGIDALRVMYPDVPVVGHKADLPLAANRVQQAKMFHLPINVTPLEMDRFVDDKSILTLGKEEIKVISTPGHSPGGVCYYIPSASMVITGDTLFAGSIGRVDLPGGNGTALLNSVRNKLMSLPPSTIVYPGHGPATTISQEEHTNPFLR